MKDLKVICGKNLNINEFLVKKHTTNNGFEIRIPKFEWEDYEPKKYLGFKSVNIEGPFVLYNDKYHNALHIAHYNDMLCNVAIWEDYEDFDESDIIASFSTLKEAVMYMLDKQHVSKKDIEKLSDPDEGYPGIKTGTYDSEGFFKNILSDALSDQDVIDEYDNNKLPFEMSTDQFRFSDEDIKKFKKDFTY